MAMAIGACLTRQLDALDVTPSMWASTIQNVVRCSAIGGRSAQLMSAAVVVERLVETPPRLLASGDDLKRLVLENVDDYLKGHRDDAELLRSLRRLLAAADGEVVVCRVQAARLAAYVDEHLDESLTLTTLAQTSGWDAPYLGRVFRESHGMSFHAFLRSRRLFRAAALLRKGYSVAAAMEEVGWSNRARFTRAFVETFGCRPSKY